MEGGATRTLEVQAKEPVLMARMEEAESSKALPPDAIVKEEGKFLPPPMPSNARWSNAVVAVVKEEGKVPPMPRDAVIKQERVVVDVERSDDRPVKKRKKRAPERASRGCVQPAHVPQPLA